MRDGRLFTGSGPVAINRNCAAFWGSGAVSECGRRLITKLRTLRPGDRRCWRVRIPEGAGAASTSGNSPPVIRSEGGIHHARRTCVQCKHLSAGFSIPQLCDLSADAVMRRVPSREYEIVVITLECPISFRRCSPRAASQIIPLLSQLPVTTLVPSGQKATHDTPAIWPLSVWRSILGFKLRHLAARDDPRAIGCDRCRQYGLLMA